MKIILLTTAILIFGFTACAQKSPTKTESKKNEPVKTERSKTEPLKVGEVAPDFTLTDQDGTKITLSEAKNPVLLVFYRGYW